MLAQAERLGPEAAMDDAAAVLNRAVDQPAGADLRARIVELCERLFRSIGLQTSVAKYHASGAERGAVLDFVDNPLNNRWWLEDEFTKIRAMPARSREGGAAQSCCATWEHPGPGSFYDAVGRSSRSRPHVVRGDGEDANPLVLVVGQRQEPRPPLLAGDPLAEGRGLRGPRPEAPPIASAPPATARVCSASTASASRPSSTAGRWASSRSFPSPSNSSKMANWF